MIKILKKISMFLLAAVMTTSVAYGAVNITDEDIQEGLAFCKQHPIKMTLDGEKVVFGKDQMSPVIINGRTLIPARALFEAMGGTVGWSEKWQQVTVYYKDEVVILTIGSEIAKVNNEKKLLEVPALIIDHDGDGYGSTMIPVRFTAEEIGCDVGWDEITRTVKIKSPVKEETKDPVVDKNETTTDPNKNQTTDEDQTTSGAVEEEVYVPTYFAEDFDISDKCTTGIVWTGEMLNEAAKGKIVAIDTGHGGKDPGSIGHKGQADELYEKTLNLKAGLKLSEYLRAAGVTTVLLKDDDSYLALLERATIANDLGATLFVSCHNNSNPSGKPNGTEVHYYSKLNKDGKTEMELYGIESKNVAQKVRVNMTSTLGLYDRGLKSSPALAVLNKTWMPAIIIEGAFLSNEGDFAVMKDVETFTDKYALGAAKGIIAALNAAYK